MECRFLALLALAEKAKRGPGIRQDHRPGTLAVQEISLLQVIVGSFLCDLDVVGMALPQAGRGNPDKPGFLFEFI